MNNQKKHIVIIGATSTIAEHCARIWVNESAVDLTLVVRDENKAEAIAIDLRVRSPNSDIRIQQADFEDPQRIQSLIDEIFKAGNIDLVLIAHGSLPDQTICQADLGLCKEAININAISPVLFAEAIVGHMLKRNTGTLALMGSVAGDRGRKSNYIYGAAKGLVTRYAQGLQHRLAKTNVKVVLIKPGPTETRMTAHLKQQGMNLANVEEVAQEIAQGINHGKTVVYAPKKWALIMMIIRHLPDFIFNRMDI